MEARTKQWLAAMAWLGTACGVELDSPPEVSPLSMVKQEAVVSNGTNLNGTNLNGTNLNGTNLNGATLNESDLQGVWIQGGELRAQRSSGALLSGEALVGVRFKGTSSSGENVRLRIDTARPGEGHDADVWFYGVSYRGQTGDTWYPLCAEGEEAVVLTGRWDYREGVPTGGDHIEDVSQFTFGCRRAALAKCVEMGYKPWRSVNGVALGDHHQACTRMLRADFCGDGTPHTQDGRVINVYDALGIQVDTESWVFEGEWGVNGAECINALTRGHEVLPPCYLEKVHADCGALWRFGATTLLMSEFPPL